MSKKITLLGSTGSIGTQSLDVIRAQGYDCLLYTSVRGRDLQLVAFTAHGLDQDGQVQLTTAHNAEGIGSGRILHLQSNVLQQFLLQTVTDLTAGNVLALTAGQRAVIDGEGHFHGGVVDLHEGQRLYIGGAAQGLSLIHI